MRLAVPFLAALLLLSCSRPSVYESFQRLPDGAGTCHFEVDMSDSASTYDIDFYSRLDGKKRCQQAFPVQVRWTSPSGAVYSEEIIFPVDGRSVRFSDAVSTQLQIPYRSFMKPLEAGVWGLELAVDSVTGLCGIGIVCERKDNGTR